MEKLKQQYFLENKEDLQQAIESLQKAMYPLKDFSERLSTSPVLSSIEDGALKLKTAVSLLETIGIFSIPDEVLKSCKNLGRISEPISERFNGNFVISTGRNYNSFANAPIMQYSDYTEGVRIRIANPEIIQEFLDRRDTR